MCIVLKKWEDLTFLIVLNVIKYAFKIYGIVLIIIKLFSIDIVTKFLSY